MKITTSKKFRQEINEMVEQKGVTYFDAVIHYCSTNNVEVETAAKLLSPEMKKLIAQEANDLHLLKKNDSTV